MHKAHPVPRQGTFDIGPAQLDTRGSIRRGEVELPVVDKSTARQTASDKLHDKSHKDSGLHSHSPSSKERSSPLDRGLVDNRQDHKVQEDSHHNDKGEEEEDNPRYVDHNKLFPEHAEPGQENPISVDGASGEDASRQHKEQDGKSSPRYSSRDEGSSLGATGKEERDASLKHVSEEKRTAPSGEGLNTKDSDQKRKRSDTSSKSTHTQPGKLRKLSPTSPTEGTREPARKSSDESTRSQQAAKATALNRLKARGEQSNSDPERKETKAGDRKEVHSPKQHVDKKTQNSPGQGQSQQAQSDEEKKQTRTKREPKNNGATKESASNISPSLETVNKKKQQETSHVATETEAHETEKKNGRDTDPPSASAPVPLSDSSTNTSHQAFVEPTPHVQPNPFLPSDHPTSIPPQDHTRRASNPLSKKRDSLKDSRQTANGTPGSDQKTTAPDKSSGAKTAGDTVHVQGQGQGPGTMSTMAEGRRMGGGADSLSQVTAERDQLLKNERTYKQRILQLEEEVKSVVKQSQELSADNRLLSNKLEAFETKVYGGSLELKELRREKQDLVTMVAKTTGEKQDMDAENDRLKSKLAEADSKSRQWDALYVENNKLKTKQAELEKKVMDLENEKLKLKNSVSVAESSQLDKLAAVQNENKKLQAELINLQTKNGSMERKVERLEADNKEWMERMEQKKTELDELMRAMKAETNTEMELKEANQELEFAKNKIEDYKRDITEANHRYEVLEKEKDSAKNALRLKESECKGLRATSEEKDAQISELKRQVDATKRNVKRLEDDLEDTKQVEKDVINMKARIRSLKNEIEDSLGANHKMKQERTEARLEADRLNRELASTSQAMNEARRYIKKLEGERGSRDKLEEELRARTQREQELERQTHDMNSRNEQLRMKVRQLEQDKEDLLKTSVIEVETNNKKLQEDNKKLRQMIVERNMEIAQRHSERHALVNRVDDLERKQNDSEIRVQQLKGWVDNAYTYGPATPTLTLPDPHPTVALPPVPTKTRQSKATAGGGAVVRRKKGQYLPQQHKQNQLNRSWEDLNRLKVEHEESIRTTPGLPEMAESKYMNSSLQAQPGYFDLYKNKMKLIRGRKW